MMQIVIADDHALFRQSLSALLHSREGFEVIGEAGNGDDALAIIQEKLPDVAILDISMPGSGGLEIAEILRKQGLNVKVLLLTMLTGPDLLQQAMDAGVDGFLLKEDTFEELVTALQSLEEEGTYISPAAVARMLPEEESGIGGNARLTLRELEVLKCIASGRSNKKIAGELHISVKTVETHRTRIMRKLNLHGTADLVRYAMMHGMI